MRRTVSSLVALLTLRLAAAAVVSTLEPAAVSSVGLTWVAASLAPSNCSSSEEQADFTGLPAWLVLSNPQQQATTFNGTVISCSTLLFSVVGEQLQPGTILTPQVFVGSQTQPLQWASSPVQLNVLAAPLVQLTSPSATCACDSPVAQLGVQLLGASPLEAVVEVLLHAGEDVAQVVGNTRLRWQPYTPPEARVQTVLVRFNKVPESGQVSLQLRALQNAVALDGNDTAKVLVPAPMFNLTGTQVLYRNASASQPAVQVQVIGCSPFPSVLNISTRMLHQQGCPAASSTCADATQVNTTLILSTAAAASGGNGTAAGSSSVSPATVAPRSISLLLPLNLSALPDTAELRLSLLASAASNARVAAGHAQLFVFGIGEGQCPSGTSVVGEETQEDEARRNSTADGLEAWSLSACCDKQAQRVRIPLDPPFSPNITSYRLLLPTTPPLTFRQQLYFSRTEPTDVVLLAWTNCTAASSQQLLPVDGPLSKTVALDLTGQREPCSLIALVMGQVSTQPLVGTGMQGNWSNSSLSVAEAGDAPGGSALVLAGLGQQEAAAEDVSTAAQGQDPGSVASLLDKPSGNAAALLQPAAAVMADGEGGGRPGQASGTGPGSEGAAGAGAPGPVDLAVGDAAAGSTAAGPSNSSGSGGRVTNSSQGTVNDSDSGDGGADTSAILATLAAAVLNSTANGTAVAGNSSELGSGGVAAVRRYLKARYTLHVVPLSDPSSYRLRALAFGGARAVAVDAVAPQSSQQQQQQQQQGQQGQQQQQGVSCQGGPQPNGTLLRSQLLPLCGLPRALTTILGLQGDELQQLMRAAAAASAPPDPSLAGASPDVTPAPSAIGAALATSSPSPGSSAGYVASLVRLLPPALQGEGVAVLALQQLLAQRGMTLQASDEMLSVDSDLPLGPGDQSGQRSQALAQVQQQQQQRAPQMQQGQDQDQGQAQTGNGTSEGSPSAASPCPSPASSSPSTPLTLNPTPDPSSPGVSGLDVLLNPLYSLSCSLASPTLVPSTLLASLAAPNNLVAEDASQLPQDVSVRLQAQPSALAPAKGWRGVRAGQVAEVGLDALRRVQADRKPSQLQQRQGCVESATGDSRANVSSDNGGSGGLGSVNSSRRLLQMGSGQGALETLPQQQQQQQQQQPSSSSPVAQQPSPSARRRSTAAHLNASCTRAVLQQTVAVAVTSSGADGVSAATYTLLLFDDPSLAVPLATLPVEHGPSLRPGLGTEAGAAAGAGTSEGPLTNSSGVAGYNSTASGVATDAGNSTGSVVSDGPEWVAQQAASHNGTASSGNGTGRQPSQKSNTTGNGGSSAANKTFTNSSYASSLQASQGDWVNALLQQQLFSSWSRSWPRTPSQDCFLCPVGMYSPTPNQPYCQLCPPGTYADTPRSSACSPCPAGTFTSQWGTVQCRSCIMGTFADSPGSLYCNVCPTGTTSQASAPSCSLALPGDPMAVLAAGGGVTSVLLLVFAVTITAPAANFEQLSAESTGIAGSSATILKLLLQADVASFFKIPSTQVQVLAMWYEQPGVVTLNVSAVLPLMRPPAFKSTASYATAAAATPAAGNSGGGADGSRKPSAGPGGGGASSSSGTATAPSDDGSDLNGDALVNSLLDSPDPFPQTTDATGGSMTVSVQGVQVIRLDAQSQKLNLNLVIWPTVSGGLLCGLLVGLLYMRKHPACCSRLRRWRHAPAAPLSSRAAQGYEWWSDGTFALATASSHSGTSSGTSGSGPSIGTLETTQLRGAGDRPSAGLRSDHSGVEVQLQELHALPGGLVAARFRVKAGSRVSLAALDADAPYGSETTANPMYSLHLGGGNR